MDMFIFNKDHTQFRSFIYRNLTKDCWSVRALEGPNKGRVVLHAKYVAVSGVDASFRVSEAGRQRVLREKRKNVHAGIVGSIYWADVLEERYDVPTSHRSTYDKGYAPNVVGEDGIISVGYRQVAYDPYKYDGFMFPDTGSYACIDDPYDQSIQLDAGGKVYVMSHGTLGQAILAKWDQEEQLASKVVAG